MGSTGCRSLGGACLLAGVSSARTAAGPFLRDGDAVVEDLPTPDAAGLAPGERPDQTRRLHRAPPAVSFCQLELGGALREPPAPVEMLAGQVNGGAVVRGYLSPGRWAKEAVHGVPAIVVVVSSRNLAAIWAELWPASTPSTRITSERMWLARRGRIFW